MSQRFNTKKICEASKKAVAVISLFAFALPFAGCAKKEEGPKYGKINIPGLDGSLCGAPIYIAYENGYFAEEGFDVTLISADTETRKIGLNNGTIFLQIAQKIIDIDNDIVHLQIDTVLFG